MVLIWGVQGVSRPSQSAMIERTRRFIEHCDASGEDLMVPSVVIAEYLTPFSSQQKAIQLKELHRRFFVAPLDAAAGVLASELHNKGHAAGSQSGGRHTLKSDCYIIATAIIHGASSIVTANFKEFRAIAGPRIKVEEVPEIPRQLRIPDRDDD